MTYFKGHEVRLGVARALLPHVLVVDAGDRAVGFQPEKLLAQRDPSGQRLAFVDIYLYWKFHHVNSTKNNQVRVAELLVWTTL